MDDFRLRIFSVLARTGSFTATARELGVTQPAVSQRIAELEKELGAPLFDRSRTNVTLNTRGKAFLAYADRILGLYDAATGAFASTTVPPRIILAADSALRSTLLQRQLPTLTGLLPHTKFIIVPYDPEVESDIALYTAKRSPQLPWEDSAALCASLSAVAIGSGAADAPLVVWSGYETLLTPSESARIRVVHPDPAVIARTVEELPGSCGILPITALDKEKAHPQILALPLPHLQMDLFVKARDAWQGTPIHHFLMNVMV